MQMTQQSREPCTSAGPVTATARRAIFTTVLESGPHGMQSRVLLEAVTTASRAAGSFFGKC